MKATLKLTIVSLLLGNMMFAQTNDADKLNIMVGGSFAKPKIIPGITKLALAQLTVHYKLTTTAYTVGKEKSTGAIAGAKLTTYLETTDGELTDADFQEITDYFYAYFQRRLKENGIDTVGWSAITATEFYANGKGNLDVKAEKGGNVWVSNTANKGNILYGGNIPFAFGKIKKASRFSEQIGAPAGYFHVTVDFADVMVNVDIKTSQSNYSAGYLPLTKTREFKYDAVAKPEMKVIPSNLGFCLFWNDKDQSESLSVAKDIESGVGYHEALNQDASRIKNRAFAFNKAMTPVVIETTRAKYKEAAKKALEKYADAFVAKTKEVNDGKKDKKKNKD